MALAGEDYGDTMTIYDNYEAVAWEHLKGTLGWPPAWCHVVEEVDWDDGLPGELNQPHIVTEQVVSLDVEPKNPREKFPVCKYSDWSDKRGWLGHLRIPLKRCRATWDLCELTLHNNHLDMIYHQLENLRSFAYTTHKPLRKKR